MRVTPRNVLRLIVLTIMISLPARPAPAAEGDRPALTPRVEGSNLWFNLRQLDVEGRGWNDTKAFYDRLKQSGVENLHYLEGEHLFGDDGEGSTDGSQPSDLGFMRQADIFAAALGPLLKPAAVGSK